jgi:hypothetical protein
LLIQDLQKKLLKCPETDEYEYIKKVIERSREMQEKATNQAQEIGFETLG